MRDRYLINQKYRSRRNVSQGFGGISLLRRRVGIQMYLMSATLSHNMIRTGAVLGSAEKHVFFIREMAIRSV